MPELRKDPVTGRWVIVSTDRAKRPSDFSRQQVTITGLRFCPFCPGNELRTPSEILAYRTHGAANEPGWTLRVVSNKFPVLRVEGSVNRKGEGLYDKMNGVGAHEVIIESPDHMHTLATMPEKRIEDLFWAYRDRVLDLRRDVRLKYALLFKNHGEAAGQALEHTHSQLIALPVVPKRVEEELDGAERHYEYKERCVYCDIIAQELDTATRVVLETDHFLAICPYAARFPFETWIIPKTHNSHAEMITHAEIEDLARLLQHVVRRMDSTLERPPYNLVVHSAPVQSSALQHYHWHIELIPKMTQVAGFEWGSGFYINPTPPEEAAKFMREASVTTA
ncbi:MAG TPA: galactose-1-phosphate uridylyltransferase [Bryobacteraceae bacterium]|nr:galactose-1-phosphate uridylyltransferase [Bryobacteraceae bacterium]